MSDWDFSTMDTSTPAVGYYRLGDIDPRSWAHSLRGVEAAWFARDDLVPFGLMCVRFRSVMGAGNRYESR